MKLLSRAAIIMAACGLASSAYQARAEASTWHNLPRERSGCDARPMRQLCLIHWWVEHAQRNESKAGIDTRRYEWNAEKFTRRLKVNESRYGYKGMMIPASVPWIEIKRIWHARMHRAIATMRARAAASATAAAPSATPAPAVGGYAGGFPASCVAMAEEGGSNSVAGYFGTISPPSAYTNIPASSMVSTYGDSWLNWPYSAQLTFAEQIYSIDGGSAWGPLTREKCGI